MVRWISGLHLFILLGWFMTALGDPGAFRHDWLFLREFGHRFLEGEWGALYSTNLEGFFWRYPPYALYLAGLLALLPLNIAYYLKASIETLAMVGSLYFLRRTVDEFKHFDLFALVVLSSVPFASDIIAGQSASFLLFILSFGMYQVTRHRDRAGFGVFGLLALKPNLGIGLGLWAIARRKWADVLALLTPGLLLVVASLPLGLGLWRGFFGGVVNAVEISVYTERHKQITLQSFLEVVIPDQTLATVTWLLATVLFSAVAVVAWRRELTEIRRIGLAVLLTLVVNPYGWHYDALLLAIPGFAWWAGRDEYLPVVRRLLAAVIALIWLWFPAVFYYPTLLLQPDEVERLTPSFSLVGPLLAIWLTLELWSDLRIGGPTDRVSGSSREKLTIRS